MGKTIQKDQQGRIVYKGLLSAEERKAADELLERLMKEIPEIEAELLGKYGSSILYKYYLGKRLSSYLDEHKIFDRERIYFWQEIRTFASEGENAKDRSVKRMLYEQCVLLSEVDMKIVEKLSWRQWQDLLDRPKNREDKRIFEWIKIHEGKIREDDWREFEKALHNYLRTKDTSIFSDVELFEIYESLLLMCVQWREYFKEYLKGQSEGFKKKKETKQKYHRDKYYKGCFEMKKNQRKNIDKEICKEMFCLVFPDYTV